METKYIVALIIILFISKAAFAQYKFKRVITTYKDKNPQYVDVRTIDEYNNGHNKNSINIPLRDLERNIHKIEKNRPVILVCRSGNRSGSALRLLKGHGYSNVYNGGPWTNIPR